MFVSRIVIDVIEIVLLLSLRNVGGKKWREGGRCGKRVKSRRSGRRLLCIIMHVP